MKKKRRLSTMVSVLLVFAMLLSACGGGGTSSSGQSDTGSGGGDTTAAAGDASGDSSDAQASETSSGEPKSGGVVKIGTGQSPTVIGYTPEITNNSFLQFLRTAFNSLCFYDEEGNLAPELAESWETDADAATITFHLRSGVKFSDGTDFNAEAVKWNLEQYQEAGRTEVSDIASIECPDENTVVITLEAWRSSALESIGFFVYYMSPTAFEENCGVEWARFNAVGTGPFVLTSLSRALVLNMRKMKITGMKESLIWTVWNFPLSLKQQLWKMR